MPHSATFSNAREEEHSAHEEHDLGTDLGQLSFNCLGSEGNYSNERHKVMKKVKFSNGLSYRFKT